MQSKCIAVWVSWLSFISHTVTLQTLWSLLQRVPVTFCSKNRTYVISWRLNLFLWPGWESYMPFWSCWRTHLCIWGFIRRKCVHYKHCLLCYEAFITIYAQPALCTFQSTFPISTAGGTMKIRKYSASASWGKQTSLSGQSAVWQLYKTQDFPAQLWTYQGSSVNSWSLGLVCGSYMPVDSFRIGWKRVFPGIGEISTWWARLGVKSESKHGENFSEDKLSPEMGQL